MKPAPPPLTKDLIEAYIASAVFWLVWLGRVVCTLGAPRRRRRLHLFLARLEREVESILFLKALHRFGQPPRRRRRPLSAPPGFRRRRCARQRLFFRNANVRARKASYAQRLAALVAALANPEPHIAYFFARFLRGLHGARLLACAPSAAPCADRATPDVVFSDSS